MNSAKRYLLLTILGYFLYNYFFQTYVDPAFIPFDLSYLDFAVGIVALLLGVYWSKKILSHPKYKDERVMKKTAIWLGFLPHFTFIGSYAINTYLHQILLKQHHQQTVGILYGLFPGRDDKLYGYRYTVNGYEYTGKQAAKAIEFSRRKTTELGDSVIIEYLPFNPSVHQINLDRR